MRGNIVSYMIGEGFSNILKNKKSTISSLGIMCCTMFIFGIFFVLGQNINHVVKEVEQAQGMQVFIQNEATDEEIDAMKLKIQELDGVSTVTFVSKQEALDQMKENLKGNEELLSGYEGENNIFPASYVVTLTDLKLSEEVQEQILTFDYVKKITSRDDTINMLIKIADGIRLITGVILILLIAISIFIIANTIKLTVHARRKEISIMKYVGATNSFIRWPFIVEGVLIGILAACITLLLIAGCYEVLTNKIMQSDFLSTVNLSLLKFTDMIQTIIIVYLLLGIGIGVLGSMISMRRYLEV